MKILGDVGAGHVLGRYELLMPIAQRRHGHGLGGAHEGHARVPEDRRRQDDAPRRSSDDPQFEQMFLDEARLASQHPPPQRGRDPRPRRGGRRPLPRDGVGRRRAAAASSTKAPKSAGGVPLRGRAAHRRCRPAPGLHAAHELRDDDGHAARPRAPRRLAAEHPRDVRRRR